MHEIGAGLFHSKFENPDEMILAFNEAFEEVNKYLHLLEVEVMAEESAKLSHTDGKEEHD